MLRLSTIFFGIFFLQNITTPAQAVGEKEPIGCKAFVEPKNKEYAPQLTKDFSYYCNEKENHELVDKKK